MKGSFPFSDIHHRHLQHVADLTGVAIENDLLVQQTRQHESVDRQLSIGAEIQSQLLPDHCPVIEGIELAACCRPAFQVGGDYYDFMSTRPELIGKRKERGRWAFVIGDVMGKGVPAGLLMTMLRGMLRAEVMSDLPPSSDSSSAAYTRRTISVMFTSSKCSSLRSADHVLVPPESSSTSFSIFIVIEVLGREVSISKSINEVSKISMEHLSMPSNEDISTSFR